MCLVPAGCCAQAPQGAAWRGSAFAEGSAGQGGRTLSMEGHNYNKRCVEHRYARAPIATDF